MKCGLLCPQGKGRGSIELSAVKLMYRKIAGMALGKFTARLPHSENNQWYGR